MKHVVEVQDFSWKIFDQILNAVVMNVDKRLMPVYRRHVVLYVLTSFDCSFTLPWLHLYDIII